MIPYVNDPKNEKELEEVDINHLYQYEKQTHYAWYDQILLNRPLKVVIVALLVAVVAPVVIYQFMFFSSMEQEPPDGYSVGSCVVPRAARLPCGLGNISQEQCHPQCCYDLNSHVCFHRYPSRFSYIMDRIWSEEVILHPRVATVPFSSQNSIPSLRLSIDEVTPSHMSLHFYNAQLNSFEGRKIENKNYTYHVTGEEMAVTVEAAQGLIFTTMGGPLIAANNIWEISFKLTNETMYGLGELPLTGGTVKVIYRRRGDFSSIPLIYAKVNDSYHGLLIDTEAPTEVFVHEENQIVLRSITDLGLKLHVFVGPKPSDVMAEAMKFVGFTEQLEYWMLGAHVCSESSKTPVEALSDLSDFMKLASNEGFPFDSHCGSAPIVFDSGCEQDDKLVEDAASVVRNAGKRYVPLVSPYIQYHETNQTTSEEIEIIRSNNETCVDIVSEYKHYMLQNPFLTDYGPDLFVGSVGENELVYPMYGNTSPEFMMSLWPYEVELDGVVLENNWPLDESEKSKDTSLFLPYFSENFVEAFITTPKWNATNFNDTTNYFRKHNEYGNHFATAFKNRLTHTESAKHVWSSSQWMNGEVIINRQHIDASWTNLRRELTEAALGGVSGHWFWSVPVCGDTEAFDPATQTSLCVKWYMAASYMPFIKIHSSSVSKHPLSFTGTNKILMLSALNKRLSLLPYFFTTLQSGPLLRPMFYQYPHSEHLKNLNTQYSVGDDLVIVPNLQPSQTHVHFWIPPGVWYELWGGLKIQGEEEEVITLTTTEADFLTLIRGGAVLTVQKDVRTTAEDTRLNSNFSIIIALDCEANITSIETNSSNCTASGSLFLTKNMSVIFKTNGEQLTIAAEGYDFETMCGDGAKWAHVIEDISIYGLEDLYNNYDNHRQVLPNIDLCNLMDQELVFSFLD